VLLGDHLQHVKQFDVVEIGSGPGISSGLQASSLLVFSALFLPTGTVLTVRTLMRNSNC
jgi:hypothetical protein